MFIFSRRNLLVVGLLVVAAVAAAVLGYLTLGTNVFVVLGVGLLVVGLARLLSGPQPLIGLLLMATGTGLWVGHDAFPSLTISDALSFAGGL